MGTKRVGLARTQALIENLKRNLDLNGATLKEVVITTDKAVTCSGSNSSLRVLGTSTQHGESAGSYGIYRCAYEVDFSGSTPTATLSGLVKTVATLPAQARIMQCGVICSETMANRSTDWTGSLNFVLGLTTAAAAVDDTITFTAGILSASTYHKTLTQFSSSAGGAAGAIRIASASATTSQFVIHGGAGTKLVFANSGSANVTSGGEPKLSTGKLVVWLEYLGSAAPAVLNDA